MVWDGNGVEVRDLVRVYEAKGRTARTALRGVGFDVPFGQVTGLLGPNGAGKTSCVKILTTLLAPTSGRAVVAGADVVAEPKLVQRRCGVSFGGERGLYDRLSAVDNLRYFGTMYGLHGPALRRRADELLELVRLSERARDRVEGFSRGMRQRLHIARSLIHDPPVLLLDEPSSGLDPESTREMRSLVLSLRAQGRAILLTTHDLIEAEAVCDDVLILIDGRIVRRASPTELRKQAAESMGTIVDFHARDLTERFFDALPGLLNWTRDGDSYRVYCTDGVAAAAFLTRRLEGRIDGLEINRPSLEDAYLKLVR